MERRVAPQHHQSMLLLTIRRCVHNIINYIMDHAWTRPADDRCAHWAVATTAIKAIEGRLSQLRTETVLFTTRRWPWQPDAAPSALRRIVLGGYCGVPPPPPPSRPRARRPPTPARARQRSPARRPPASPPARAPSAARRPPRVKAIVLRSEIERAIVLKTEIERPIVLGHAPHCSRVYCGHIPVLQLLPPMCKTCLNTPDRCLNEGPHKKHWVRRFGTTSRDIHDNPSERGGAVGEIETPIRTYRYSGYQLNS